MKKAALVVVALFIVLALSPALVTAEDEPEGEKIEAVETAEDEGAKEEEQDEEEEEAVEEGVLILEKGTVIVLEFAQSLSSQMNRTGEEVHYRVVEDMKVDGVVVIAAGADAFGEVVHARPAKGWGKSGKLEVSVEKVTAVDGSTVKLAASFEDSKSWSGAKTIVGVAAFGALFGGGMKGKKVNINEGHKLEVFIAEDTEINPYAEDEDEAKEDAKACLNLCSDEKGEGFKGCMTECDECKEICAELVGDDLVECLMNCLEEE